MNESQPDEPRIDGPDEEGTADAIDRRSGPETVRGDVEIESRDGIVVASWRGEIDGSNVESFHDEIRSATVGSRGVVLDLSAVEYLDSVALYMIHRIFVANLQAGRPLRVVAPKGSFTHRLLAIAGMDGGIGVEGSLDQALAHVAEP